MDQRHKIRRLEIEADKEVMLRQLNIDLSKPTPTAAANLYCGNAFVVALVIDLSQTTFDFSKHIASVPTLSTNTTIHYMFTRST